MLEQIFIIIGIFLRLAPHTPNFTPISAAAIFAGVRLKKRYAILIPLVTMLISDYLLLYINPYSTHFIVLHKLYPLKDMFHSTTLFVYISFLISGLIGIFLRNKRNIFSTDGTKIAKPLYLISASVIASTQFFLITNFGVWTTGMYSRGLDGLLESYMMGLPFFKWTLLGDMFYTVTFFGLYVLARQANARAFHHNEEYRTKNV